MLNYQKILKSIYQRNKLKNTIDSEIRPKNKVQGYGKHQKI